MRFFACNEKSTSTDDLWSPAGSTTTITGSAFALSICLGTNQPDNGAEKGAVLYGGTTECDDTAARTGAAAKAAGAYSAAGSLARARADESDTPAGADG